MKSNIISIPTKNGNIDIWFYTQTAVHFSYNKGKAFINPCFDSENKMDISNFSIVNNDNEMIIDTGKMKIEHTNGKFKFSNKNKTIELLDYSLTEKTIHEQATYQSEIVFSANENEAFFGLGQQQENVLNYSGHSIDVYHDYKGVGGEKIGVPFMVSTDNYGILFNTLSQTTAKPFVNGVTTFIGDSDIDASFVLIMENDINDIYKTYNKIIGTIAMPLKSSLGYIQCKQRYKTQDELISVAREYRKRNYPLDMMVLDWFHWKVLGDLSLDEKYFSNATAMNKELMDMDIDSMISVWPRFMKECTNYKKLEENSWFATHQNGEIVYGTPDDRRGALIDTTNKEAGKWLFDTVHQNYGTKGFNCWWTDENEPDLFPYDFKFHMGNGFDIFNIYPYTHSKAMYEGHRHYYKNRCCILSRASYIGANKFGTQFWSSDIYPTWEVYERQITTAINFCATGLGLWSSDIGGWQALDKETIENPLLLETENLDKKVSLDDYPELYTRWFQFGAFSPIFRAHGTRPENEIWSYGEENEKIMLKYLKLRYRLMPYIYSSIYKMQNEGAPFLRGLFMDFPQDEMAKTVKDEYMFSEAILVAPVTKANCTSREVYLPKGNCWYDFDTNKKYEGGKTYTIDAPLSKLPLFVKSGSIIPMGEDVNSTKDKQDNLKIYVYGHEYSEFTIYDDDGVTYDYEKGDFTLSKITHKNGLVTVENNDSFNYEIIKI